MNVLLVCWFFFLIFGIVLVNYFKGTFYYCRLPEAFETAEIDTWQDCLDHGGYWINQFFNFDNILKAMMTLFTMSTTEGWLPVMYNGIDAVGIGYNPKFENNMGWAALFIFFIVFGSFFILNLLVGVVIDNFNIEKSLQRGELFLSPE
jgi:hypothetical protein